MEFRNPSPQSQRRAGRRAAITQRRPGQQHRRLKPAAQSSRPIRRDRYPSVDIRREGRRFQFACQEAAEKFVQYEVTLERENQRAQRTVVSADAGNAVKLKMPARVGAAETASSVDQQVRAARLAAGAASLAGNDLAERLPAANAQLIGLCRNRLVAHMAQRRLKHVRGGT